jgi:dihydroorotate dehydrogenase electron transfer subunit
MLDGSLVPIPVASQYAVEIRENVRLARDTYRLRFRCPELARRIVPGQFVMLRLSDFDDPLIGRPFALYDIVLEAESPEMVDIVYLVGGKLTRRLCEFRPLQRVDVWGPLGNGFAPQDTNHLIMVAGGIGQTPFLAVAKEHLGQQSYGRNVCSARPASRVSLCYGARSAEYLAGVPDFAALGIEVRISTDDGSAGQAGFVTRDLATLLEETAGQDRRIVCCGPERMMAAVSRLATVHQVPAQVSLETPMACGIGICFSCVALVRNDQGVVDYRRTCVEGPVFDASRVAWD